MIQEELASMTLEQVRRALQDSRGEEATLLSIGGS